MNQIYTAGYAGHTPAQLLKAAVLLNAAVFDIRYKPQSRLPGWGQNELVSLLATKYCHVAALGNVGRFEGGAMRLLNADAGLRQIEAMAKRRNVILLCGCSDYLTCHRHYVSQLLKDQGIITKEMPWPEIVSAGTIPCFSLWQPWASLVAVNAKGVETRGWCTAYRGPIAIHAAKRVHKGEMRALDTNPFFRAALAPLRSKEDAPMWDYLPLGAIVAVANLTKCVPTYAQGGLGEVWLFASLSEQERAFGDYTKGRYGWFLEDIRPLKNPTPYKGEQGIFNVDKSVLNL